MLSNPQFIEMAEDIRINQREIGLAQLQDFVAKSAVVEVKQQQKSSKDEKVVQIGKDQTISSIRVASDKLDQLMNLVSELVTTQARLSLYAENDGNPELLNIAENVQKLSRQLRDNAFSIVLIPIENMLTRFQRLVRDLSKELKKEVVFEAEGTDTELDKTIIENLTDPLMHILRNSLDHGIEIPQVRIEKGKPAQGKILLKAFYSGANVIIQVFDDGAGIDANIIRTKAIQKGLINPDIPLTKKEILDLIFIPGFSTAANVTDVSGRGVGMDVVKRKIADIRGEVDVESQRAAVVANHPSMFSKHPTVSSRKNVRRRRRGTKHITESINLPAFQVDARKQRRLYPRLTIAQQFPGLLGPCDVPGKQDHARRLHLAQQQAISGRLTVDHHR